VAQDVGPEFKSQYQGGKKNMFKENKHKDGKNLIGQLGEYIATCVTGKLFIIKLC
jgi:hypothetical protein